MLINNHIAQLINPYYINQNSPVERLNHPKKKYDEIEKDREKERKEIKPGSRIDFYC